jgi:hypothetical protein
MPDQRGVVQDLLSIGHLAAERRPMANPEADDGIQADSNGDSNDNNL